MADQNYFEDIKEGQELAPLKITPDKSQLVKFAAGSGDFNPLHFDENFPMLKPMGLTENIVHGRFKYAQTGRLVFALAGYKGRVKKFSLTSRQIILYLGDVKPGDTLTFEYTLRPKYALRASTAPSTAYEYNTPANRAEARPVELVVEERK